MEKKFNITGKCIPSRHYMADVSTKLGEAMALIAEGEYFIINRPRQYGKTTTLYGLATLLKGTGEYIVLNTSFEGVGDLMFGSEEVFSSRFVKTLIRYANVQAPDLADWLKHKAEINSLENLSDLITEMVSQTDKKVVLLIDEVDKSSNNQLFVSFLAMLRDKYLVRDDVKTFHAVVLAGVHDVKSLKLKLRPNEEQKYNSPWNIAAEFKVDMNLQPSEIKPMLIEYCTDSGVKMNTQKIADRLFYFTSGYPFLVSKLCKMLDENDVKLKKKKKWLPQDIDTAAQELIRQNNTNFEALSKNIESNKDLYRLIYQVMIDGESVPYSPLDPLTNFAMMYGIFVVKNNILTLHNRIYREVLTNYMCLQMLRLQQAQGVDFGSGYKNRDGSLNMEAVLVKFQAFMREQYSRKDRAFLERHGRLVFLGFIKPDRKSVV